MVRELDGEEEDEVVQVDDGVEEGMSSTLMANIRLAYKPQMINQETQVDN